MNDDTKIKVAVIGHGFLGKWHAQKAEMLDRAQLTLIVEPDKSLHKKIQQTYPNAEVAEKIEGHEDLFEAAVVATPTSTHFSICLDLIKKSKHVFCEKPVTSTTEQAMELLKNLPEHLVFQVGHSERCHEAWDWKDKWSRYLEGASLIEFTRVAPFKGRAIDVDVVQDLMIHDIDLLLWLTQETPVKVEAQGHKIRTDKWDHVQADFTFKSGKRAHLIVGRNHVQEERRARFINQHGIAEVDFMNSLLSICPNDAAPGAEGIETIQYQKRDHLLQEQEAFYHSIYKHSTPFVGLHEGVNAVKLVELTLLSLEKGQGQNIEIG